MDNSFKPGLPKSFLNTFESTLSSNPKYIKYFLAVDMFRNVDNQVLLENKLNLNNYVINIFSFIFQLLARLSIQDKTR